MKFDGFFLDGLGWGEVEGIMEGSEKWRRKKRRASFFRGQKVEERKRRRRRRRRRRGRRRRREGGRKIGISSGPQGNATLSLSLPFAFLSHPPIFMSSASSKKRGRGGFFRLPPLPPPRNLFPKSGCRQKGGGRF